MTDPGARWTAAHGGPAFYAYSTNYLIDLKSAIIVDVEATPTTHGDEINVTKTLIDRVGERFDLKLDRLLGDTVYGSAELLGWMINDKQIEPLAATAENLRKMAKWLFLAPQERGLAAS